MDNIILNLEIIVNEFCPSGPNKKLVEIRATTVLARARLPNSLGPSILVNNFTPIKPTTAVIVCPVPIHNISLRNRLLDNIFIIFISKIFINQVLIRCFIYAI